MLGDSSTNAENTFSRHQVHNMFYSVLWGTESTSIDAQTGSRVESSEKEALWLSKLGEWNEALDLFQERLNDDPQDFDAMLGCMHCYDATGDWRKVLDIAKSNWTELFEVEDNLSNDKPRRKAIRRCAQAAWRLGSWDELETYSAKLNEGLSKRSTTATNAISREGLLDHDFDAAFYKAVVNVHLKNWRPAVDAIEAARNAMDGRLTSLLAESYSRAYPSMVSAQLLSEMEEIIQLRMLEENSKPTESTRARADLISVWRKRLKGCRLDAETYSSIMAVRSLVLDPEEEIESTLQLSKLSRQAGRLEFSKRVLLDPLVAMGSDVDGPLVGLHLPDSLELNLDTSKYDSLAYKSMIQRVVSGNAGNIVPHYGPVHEQLSRKLVEAAGGLER